MFGLKNDEMLICFLLIIVGYTIAKMFSRRCEGFSVGGRNSCDSPGAPDLVKGKTKLMPVTITTEGGDTCNTTAETCVDDGTIFLGWSETDAPDCISDACGKVSHWYGNADDTPIHIWNSSGNHPNVNLNEYDGKWEPTGQNSDNLYTLTDKDVESLCFYDKSSNETEEYSGCMSGTRALCGYKINSAKKCEGVKGGIPGYCKKNEYCCNRKCCSKPCSIKDQTCRS